MAGMLRLMNDADRARDRELEGGPFVPTTPGVGPYRCGNCRQFSRLDPGPAGQTCQQLGVTADTMPCAWHPRAPHRAFDPIVRAFDLDLVPLGALYSLEVGARRAGIARRATRPEPPCKPGEAVQFVQDNRLVVGRVVEVVGQTVAVQVDDRQHAVAGDQVLPAGRPHRTDGAVVTQVKSQGADHGR
jgi:hypothetical protein